MNISLLHYNTVVIKLSLINIEFFLSFCSGHVQTFCFASMVTLNGDEELDEAHCLWALCQHPCCWETEHRIAEGVCRRRVKASNHVESCAVKGGLTPAIYTQVN